ncbi:TIR domain-containing protein [Streptomyces sp. NPDC059788]|uniref:nSTAND1 domain-containing NTPase n=1 Tax=Streptomyces sp. NPDC059788 TaxID=3346948 RepID=UPI003647FF23
MTSLFVSHSSRDREATERVVGWLRDEGFAGLFIDFDPEQGIPVGRRWENELYSQLRRTDGVVFLASESSVASQWCFVELALARSLRKPIFALRLDGTARLNLLRDLQWLDLSDEASALPQLRDQLRRAGLDAGGSFPWDATRSPYPGLRTFTAQDAAVFCGRDQETEDLLRLLQPTLQRGPGRFVAIMGPSGSGKSSLLHAGVLPRLGRGHRPWVVVPPLLPGSDPVRTLAHSLQRACAACGLRPLPDTARLLDGGPPALAALATDLSRAQGDRRDVLLVIDQAEELLTSCGAGKQQEFLRLLTGALGDSSPLWALATVRSEFLSTSPDRAGLTEAIDDTLPIEPLSRARLPEVIARPAQRAGIDLGPGLVEKMAEETRGGDALPLLAFTLGELYARVGPDRSITVADYEAVGGVVGALQRRADRLLEDLNRRGRGALVLPTLLQLAAVDSGSEPTRRHRARSDLNSEELAVLDSFVDARLLTSDRDRHGEPTVTVAHEALLRRWPPLRDAIKESRESLSTRTDLERLAADWDSGERNQSYLPRVERAEVLGAWAAAHAGELSHRARQFGTACRALAARELAAARRTNRRLRVLTTGLTVFLALTLLAGGLALWSNERAQSRARLSLSDQLSAQADRLAQSQPDTAVLVGLESLSAAHDDRDAPQPPAGLVSGLARIGHASRLLTGHRDQVQSAAFSPDGSTLATGSWDRTVRLWDTATGTQRGKALRGHTEAVLSVAFSPDGKRLATSGLDGAVRLWDTGTQRPVGPPLRTGQGDVTGVAFSPDGKRLATSGLNGTVRLWDVGTWSPYGDPLEGHEDVVTGVAFSPDGKWLASTSWDETVRLWPLEPGTGADVRVLRGHSGLLRSVAFSRDGKRLATGGEDGTARIWEVATGRPSGLPLRGHKQDVWAVAFSPDGKRLATAGGDKTARLWDTATGKQVGQPFIGHTSVVLDVDFSPDGKRVATASWDQTVRQWDVAESYSVSRPIAAHAGGVNGVAFSPDGTVLATAGLDGAARRWRVGSGEPLGEPLEHGEEVNRVAFSRVGGLLATAGGDGTVRLWKAASGAPLGPPVPAHEGAVQDVAFSPDGRLLASAGADATARLWWTATRQPSGTPLAGHQEAVNGVAFSPDGRLLATASTDQTVGLWNVPDGTPHGPALKGHTNEIRDLAFSPDGKLLATAGADRTVRLWDPSTGRQHGRPLTGHTDTVEDVAFSPDGELLATAGADGTVRLWDVATGRPYGPVLTGHRGSVRAVAFAPRGSLVASAGADGTARLWDTAFASWTRAGCALVNRNLTQAEWDQYLPGIDYHRTCPGLPSGTGAPRDAPAASY